MSKDINQAMTCTIPGCNNTALEHKWLCYVHQLSARPQFVTSEEVITNKIEWEVL